MPTLAQTIAQACGEAVAKALADDKQLLEDVAKAGGEAASNGLLGDVEDVVSILSNLLGDIPIIGGLLSDVADPIHAVEKSAGRFGRGFGLGWVVGSIMWQLIQPLMLPVQHAVNAHTTNELYDPATAAQLAAKGIISTEQGRSESSGDGLDVPHFDGLLEAARNYPALGEALRLLNLQAIGEADVQTFLTRQGVPEQYHAPLMELRRLFLSPADLALANLRGFLEDGTAQEYAKLLGMDANDFAVLIANTGEPPGTMQLLEAYRRGYIHEDRLARGVRQSRVRDEWLDVIKDLRYQRMSPIDAIRAYVQHHLNEEQARQIAQDGGLYPDDFDPLYETYGNPISVTGALELYHRGEMKLADVEQAIHESRYKDKYTADIIKLGRRMISFFELRRVLAAGTWTPEQGIKYLMEQGYDQADAAAMVSTSTSTKSATVKGLTETQIMDMYETKAITSAQAQELLKNIGYAPAETSYVLDALDAKASLTELNKAINAVRAAYMADRIPISDARNQLDALGVLASHRDQLLKDWQLEHKAIVKVLTPAQWASAIYYGLVSYDYGVQKIESLGYDRQEALLLADIRLHGLGPHQTQRELES